MTSEQQARRPSRLRRAAVDVTPLRTSPGFRRLWTSQTIAYVAWRMMLVLVPVQVYRETGSTLDVGLYALTQFVPLVLVTIVGGALADTRDRRSLLLVSNIGIAIFTAAFVVVSIPHHTNVVVLFVLGFFAWSSFALGSGAVRSVTPRLVPLDQLPAAAALNGLYTNLGLVIGPALAGVLIDAVGLSATYGISLAGMLVAIVAVVGMERVPPEDGAPRLSFMTLVEGFRYLGTQRLVLGFFLIDTLAMIFGMPNALFPALAQHVFRNPASVGYLFAAPALGAFLISVFSGWASRVRRQGIAIVVSASGWGVAIAAFGLTRSLWVGLLLLAAAGAADQVSAIFRATIVLTVTPDAMRGRLGGIEFAQVASSPALGNVEAGVVAQLTSLRFSIVSGGVACVIGALAVAALFPVLLRYDAQAHADPVA